MRLDAVQTGTFRLSRALRAAATLRRALDWPSSGQRAGLHTQSDDVLSRGADIAIANAQKARLIPRARRVKASTFKSLSLSFRTFKSGWLLSRPILLQRPLFLRK